MQPTYQQVENLIPKLAKAFCRKHGGDWEEMVSELNYVFVQRRDEFDPSLGLPFVKDFVQRGWWAMLNLHRKNTKQRIRLVDCELLFESTQDFNFVDFLDELTIAGKYALKLLLVDQICPSLVARICSRGYHEIQAALQN